MSDDRDGTGVHDLAQGANMSPVSAPPPARRRRRRPFPLLVLILIMIFRALLIFLVVLGSFQLDEATLLKVFQVPAIRGAVEEAYIALIGLLVLGALVLVSAVGLLMWKRLAWVLAMVMTGIFVLFDIIGFAEGTANYVWMALNIITVFYLNQREVRLSVGAVFDGDTGSAPTTATPA